ncbi:MAG: PGPGW domain-containing protein [Marmoricola sp.]
MKSTAKRVVLEAAGWLLVVVGLAALVLPGPGLLALFAGVALLATQYEWAERRLEPVKKRAMRAAADSVKSWPRILLSTLGVLWLIGLGISWGIGRDVPRWWPLADKWWMPGGWGTGASLIGSGLIAGVMIAYSYKHYREIKDEQLAEHSDAA